MGSMGHKYIKCSCEKVLVKKQLKNISWEMRIYLKQGQGYKKDKKLKKKCNFLKRFYFFT